MTARPWLAKCIRELHLTKYGLRPVDQRLTLADPPNVLPVTTPFIGRPKLQAAFLAKLCTGEPNAKAAALLLAASRLERLVISFNENSWIAYDAEEAEHIFNAPTNYQWLEEVLIATSKKGQGQKNTLNRLSSIHILSPFDFYPMRLNNVAFEVFSYVVHTAFLLPTLRHLNITADSFSIKSF